MKVIYFSEDLSYPFDEGIKKTAFLTLQIINNSFDVIGFCKYGADTDQPKLINIPSNKLLLNKSVKKLVNSTEPDIILYLPSSSATFASFIRIWIMGLYSPKAKTAIISLQPKSISYLYRIIVKMIKPDICLSPSPLVLEQLSAIGIKGKLIPLFVDIHKFKPIVNKDRKIELRKKYNFPINRFIISHMGHLNYGRNLDSLIQLQNDKNQIIISSSTSTPIDAPKEDKLKKKLIDSGIIIIDKYIEYIEEIYQLSDLYIFPVIFNGGSIGMPLSIMEARACGIPVLTTDYGSVKLFLDNDYGNIYYSEPVGFLKIIETIKNNRTSHDRTKVHDLNNMFIDALKSLFQ